MKVFREMNEDRQHDTSGKEGGPNLVHTESREQPQVVMVNSTDSPKQDQVVDPSCDMVPGTCMKCQSDIMGPPNDRGGDNMKTWHKYCKECYKGHKAARYAVSGTCRQCNAEFMRDKAKTWLTLCKKCFATQKRCNTSEIHNTGRPQQVNLAT